MGGKTQDAEGVKNRRDPISSIFKGLIIVFLGVSFLLSSLGIIGWSRWLAFFLFGLGCIFLVEVLIRYTVPACWRPCTSKLVWGCVLAFIGGLFLIGSAIWWPLIIIVAGIAVLIRAVLKLRK